MEQRSSNYSNVEINVGKMWKCSSNSENVCFKGKYLTRGDTLYSDGDNDTQISRLVYKLIKPIEFERQELIFPSLKIKITRYISRNIDVSLKFDHDSLKYDSLKFEHNIEHLM